MKITGKGVQLSIILIEEPSPIAHCAPSWTTALTLAMALQAHEAPVGQETKVLVLPARYFTRTVLAHKLDSELVAHTKFLAMKAL